MPTKGDLRVSLPGDLRDYRENYSSLPTKATGPNTKAFPITCLVWEDKELGMSALKRVA